MEMKKFLKKVCFFSFLPIAMAFCIDMPIEDVVIKRDRTFEGEALYGFMNGGSELFLEYDFKVLRAVEVLYKGEEYSIELYRMETPEDAFGIYSQHTHRCILADTLNRADCFSRYQMQSVVGNTYISIVYSKPAQGVEENAIELMEYFWREIVKDEFVIPQELQVDGNISGKLRMYKGFIALNNNAPELLQEISGEDEYKIWSYDTGEGRKILIITPDRRELKIID